MTEPSTSEEMACRELVGVIGSYLDGTLPPADRDRFEAHLDECPYCVNYLDQMRETIAALGELTVDSIDPRRRREIVEAFADWQRR